VDGMNLQEVVELGDKEEPDIKHNVELVIANKVETVCVIKNFAIELNINEIKRNDDDGIKMHCMDFRQGHVTTGTSWKWRQICRNLTC
jgi:DNA/RNA-binding domain of Phe-tRNA-synthetase-like protein